MRQAPPKPSILWWFTGGMVLIFSVAGGSVLSGGVTAVAAIAGTAEESIAAMAVATLLLGFSITLAAALHDLAGLARRREPALPRRWAIGSMAALFVAGPFWRFCVVHLQEPISGSDSVRIAFDVVLYALVLTLIAPLVLGVPLSLTRPRRPNRVIEPQTPVPALR